jgi:hypothetical protein
MPLLRLPLCDPDSALPLRILLTGWFGLAFISLNQVNTSLRVLNLTYNAIGAQGGSALAQALRVRLLHVHAVSRGLWMPQSDS